MLHFKCTIVYDYSLAWWLRRAGRLADLGEDYVLALQPRTDTPVPKHTEPTSIWPEPQILEAVGAKVCLVNSSQEPKLFGGHKHLSQILPTEETSSPSSTPSIPSL